MKYTKEFIAPHVEQWRASGLSKAGYCKQHGIAYHSFMHFYKRYFVDELISGFTLLEPQGSPEPVKLHLRNGFYFSLPEHCSTQVLRKLIEACSA